MHRSPRFSFVHFFSALMLVLTSTAAINAQSASTNINMVSGTGWPNGDPFLQRQDEPTLAVSSRNPLHLFAGSVDYRSVDLPGLADGKVTGDAWLGIFKSRDGGLRWNSTLLPGYPQDNSTEGLASPIKGLTAAADPIVRGGTNGLFYYGGIAFNRSSLTAPNKIFIARFLDKNNRENGDTIKYVNTVAVQTTVAGDFADKPWLAVDIPRANAPTCTVDGESFKGGNVYLAWTLFSNNETQGKIMFSRSTNCGASWSTPIILSTGQTVVQGATVAVSPLSGYLYVAWRRFASGSQTDAIFVARSTNGGVSFTAPVQVATLPANGLFDQGTTNVSFRTNSYPTMTIDLEGRIYLAWSQRGVGPGGDTRVVLTTSFNAVAWATPAPVENHAARGHQLMPSLSFSPPKLMLAYYDLREDSTIAVYQRDEAGGFVETRQAVGDLAGQDANPAKVFNSQVADVSPTGITTPIRRRHTIDVRMVQANPSPTPAFGSSQRITRYDYGSRPGAQAVEQLEFNPPNLPMFKRGTAAFMGDYIDLAATLISPTLAGSWTNGDPSLLGGAHIAWADNRDVQPPPPGKTWADYTPPISVFAPAGSTSIFDPTQTRPVCSDTRPGFSTAGMRNQNIYTSRVTQGLYVGLLGNTKPLGASLQRGFAMFAQNNLNTTMHVRLTISNQPAGGVASFLPTGAARTSLDVSIATYSSIARTVFVTSSDPKARVLVQVQQITAPGGTVVSGGLKSGVMLNPDSNISPLLNPENPTPGLPSIVAAEAYNVTIGASEIRNPEIANPEIANPEIANPEIANPEIANPEIANPEIANPEIANPEIANPEIANPEIANPEIANPEIANPEIANPEIANPEIANGSMTDASWAITNTGNTAAAYTLKLLSDEPAPSEMKFQLMVYWTIPTLVVKNCSLTQETNYIVLANIISPNFVTNPANLINQTQDLTAADIKNVTIALEPGQIAKITLRAVGASKAQVVNYLTTHVKPAAVAQAANTGTTIPQSSLAGVGVATSLLPAGVAGAAVGTPYSANLFASGGTAPYTWSLASGTLPTGLSLSPSGVISGAPTVAGLSTFTVRVTDGAGQMATRTVRIQIKATASALLSFQAQPTNTALNQDISAPGGVQVLAMQGGNPVPGLSVTIAIGANPGSGTLTGFATAATNASGVATFPNLRLNANGVGYTLLASASGAAQITSNAFDIGGVSPTLSFQTHPPNVMVNQPLVGLTGVQVVVDQATVPVVGVNVTIAIGTNPGGGTLSGTLTAVTDGAGVATFPDLSINAAGNGYTLVGSASGATSVASNAFNVTSGPSVVLSFETFSTFVANNPGNGGLAVKTRNLLGQVLEYYPVTIALGANPENATLAGTLTTDSGSYGTAFFNPDFSRGGYGYTFVASAPGAVSVTSDSVLVEGFSHISTGTMTDDYEFFHTTTLLPNGQVLIAGGISLSVPGSPPQNADLYNPASNAFTAANPMVTKRWRHTATLLPNGKVLIAGGGSDATGSTVESSAELYDPTTGNFTATAGVMTAPRWNHQATLLPNGKVLIVGGSSTPGSPTTALDSVECYDPVTDTFTAIVSAMLTPRVRFTLTVLRNGLVLITGGENGAPLQAAELFDPGANRFFPLPPMNFSRSTHTATLLPNGKVLIVGSNLVSELYDPDTQTFTLTAGETTNLLSNHTATLLPNGTVLVLGTPGQGEIYDPATDTFRLSGMFPLPGGLFGGTATLLPNGRVFFAGGYPTGGTSTVAHLFYPVMPPFPTVAFTPTAGDLVNGFYLTPLRYLHTTTLLPSGQVLITGGTDFEHYFDTVELFDPETEDISLVGSMAQPRYGHLSILLPNGGVLIAGGITAGNAMDTAELYNPLTGVFDPAGNMSAARFNATGTLLPNGKVLITGGLDDNDLLASAIGSAEVYDPATNTFSAAIPMTARADHTATLLPNGKVLLTAGRDGAALNSAQLFDPDTNTFTATGSLNVARYNHTAVLLPNGKVLIAGGQDADAMDSAELYDPATGTFTLTGTMTTPRFFHTAVLLPNGKVLVEGGSSTNMGSADLNSTELYDPATEAFSAHVNMGAERSRNHTVTLLPNGKVLVTGGGVTSPLPRRGTELYSPGQ